MNTRCNTRAPPSRESHHPLSGLLPGGGATPAVGLPLQGAESGVNPGCSMNSIFPLHRKALFGKIMSPVKVQAQQEALRGSQGGSLRLPRDSARARRLILKKRLPYSRANPFPNPFPRQWRRLSRGKSTHPTTKGVPDQACLAPMMRGSHRFPHHLSSCGLNISRNSGI